MFKAAPSQCDGSCHNDELCLGAVGCRATSLAIKANRGASREDAELKRSQSIVIKVGFEGK